MFQFFVDEVNIALNKEACLAEDGESILGNAYIDGEDVNHIKNVLRMKEGQKIRISTHQGANYFCRIDGLGDTEIACRIIELDERGTELPCQIYLFQGLPKGDKMELIIQKTVELGVTEIIPVAMKNCVMKLDEKKADKKLARWQAISEAAAKQSKRSIVPIISQVMNYREALKRAEEMDLVLIPYENEEGMEGTRKAMQSIAPGMKIALFIGPEGGFDPKEIDLLSQDMKLLSLGRRILRTETAGFTAMSILMYHMELL